LKIRFLADANFNQKIVAGLLVREPQVDFELPQNAIPEKMEDPEVLKLGAARGRIIVTHDVRTMLAHFGDFVAVQPCPGLILAPKKMPIGAAIEDLLVIWQVSEAAEWVNQMRRLPLQQPMRIDVGRLAPRTRMDVTLPADLTKQVERELAVGHYRSLDELIEQAIRHLFDERQGGQQRLDGLRRIGRAVDQAGLYEGVSIPGRE